MSGTTQARARVAAPARHRSESAPDLSAARRTLTDARAESYIRKLVDAAPPLSDDARRRLAVLLLTGGEAA